MGDGIGWTAVTICAFFGACAATCGDSCNISTIKTRTSTIKTNTAHIQEDVHSLTELVTGEPTEENVFGFPAKETFYTINKQRCYITIDGMDPKDAYQYVDHTLYAPNPTLD